MDVKQFMIGKPRPLAKDGLWTKGLDIDEGIFEYAAKEGKSVSMFLEEVREQVKGEESPYFGMTKAEVLRTKEAIRKAGQIPPLTALEEMFKILGIQVSGAFTDKINKIYEVSGANVVFAEFWSDRVYAGLLKMSPLADFIAMETVINASNYQKVYMTTLEQYRQLRRVGEYEEFPELKITLSKQSLVMQMFGAYMKTSYKAMSEQRINFLEVALQRIGQQIAIDQYDDFVTTARLGDGNSNTPTTTVESVATGNIGTRDLVNWATGLPTPYKMDKFVGKKALLQEYMVNLADYNSPAQTWSYIDSKLKPGATFLPVAYEWDRSSIPTDNFLGFDTRFAMEHITNGAVLVETEKVIRQQYNGVAISHGDCFGVIDCNAIAIFDETH